MPLIQTHDDITTKLRAAVAAALEDAYPKAHYGVTQQWPQLADALTKQAERLLMLHLTADKISMGAPTNTDFHTKAPATIAKAQMDLLGAFPHQNHNQEPETPAYQATLAIINAVEIIADHIRLDALDAPRNTPSLPRTKNPTQTRDEIWKQLVEPAMAEHNRLTGDERQRIKDALTNLVTTSILASFGNSSRMIESEFGGKVPGESFDAETTLIRNLTPLFPDTADRQQTELARAIIHRVRAAYPPLQTPDAATLQNPSQVQTSAGRGSEHGV